MNKYFEFKKLVGPSIPKLELLAVQWLSSNLCKVDSCVAIGVIQSKVAVPLKYRENEGLK